MSDKVQTLLDTLTELSRILYARPEECCTRGIVRVHNQTFLHAIVCEEVFGKPQIISEKKFYWRYTLQLYMLLSNIVLSAAGQLILNNKNVTSIHF